jgi:DNA-binding NarL/FixJ family response regulator
MSKNRHSAALDQPPVVRVLVVDDHPVVRRGLVDAINEAPGFVVSGEADTQTSALAAAATALPDVAIVDLRLGSDSGLALVDALVKTHPTVRVLVLSGHDERLWADRALRAGALGYIMKDRSTSELLTAVRRVATGKSYVSTETAERILSTLGTSGSRGRGPSTVSRLSDREFEVLSLIGRGAATREIAAQLNLSVKTVESHYARIKLKLGVASGRELVRMAISLTDGDGR